jgi:hypothetical protein
MLGRSWGAVWGSINPLYYDVSSINIILEPQSPKKFEITLYIKNHVCIKIFLYIHVYIFRKSWGFGAHPKIGTFSKPKQGAFPQNVPFFQLFRAPQFWGAPGLLGRNGRKSWVGPVFVTVL